MAEGRLVLLDIPPASLMFTTAKPVSMANILHMKRFSKNINSYSNIISQCSKIFIFGWTFQEIHLINVVYRWYSEIIDWYIRTIKFLSIIQDLQLKNLRVSVKNSDISSFSNFGFQSKIVDWYNSTLSNQ